MKQQNISRRQMLSQTAGGILGVSLFSATPWIKAFGAAPSYEIMRTAVLSQQPNLYYGWPTVGIRENGEILVVVSGGREDHVCPFGRVDLFRSKDNGQTWTWPQTIYDGPIDDRDAGILVTAKGTILVTTFTSLAYWDSLKKETELRAKGEKQWSDERFLRWSSVNDRISEEERNNELGCWMLRSTDGGVNWSERYSSTLNSPHGPFQLADGRLLYAGNDLWKQTPNHNTVGVVESKDDGQTWSFLSDIPYRPGENDFYYELHGVEAANGRLIVQIRNHNQNNNNETLQTESEDGGLTWTIPHSIGVWGIPSHLIKMKDGRLLMTYGHRRSPLGNQARISSDNGETWSEPIFLSQDGTSGDLGYPSTVQLADQSFLSVWYERMQEYPKAVLRYAHWKLND
ncbi:MAG: sialidase family protein [Planctomycetia bacterium]|nr:sialidase family protein [Planctomycetia bacterium]